jgi:hypothetical protein
MSEEYLPVVAGVAVIGDRVLRLLFSDGTAGDVDLSSERWAGVLAPLNDPAYFAEVTVDPEAGLSRGPVGSTWHRSRSMSRRRPIRSSSPPDATVRAMR